MSKANEDDLIELKVSLRYIQIIKFRLYENLVFETPKLVSNFSFYFSYHVNKLIENIMNVIDTTIHYKSIIFSVIGEYVGRYACLHRNYSMHKS